MAHKHSVYDTDLHFKIDNVTRNITSESGKVILMQNDHNSERFTFEIPRLVDGHDMSLCNVVEVHYINTESANKRNQTKDVYPVNDLQISPDSDDVVICSWLVSSNATMYAGTLHFILRYACVAEDGTIEYQWFTNIYSVIGIAQGILNTDVVTDDGDTDVLYVWKQEIDALVRPYYESAVTSAYNAAESEANAAVSEANAAASEANAAVSEANAKISEENTKESEENSKISEENARTSELNAKASEEIAATAVTQINNLNDEVLETLQEVSDSVDEYEKRIGSTIFSVNFETGNLEYDSMDYEFVINEETGNLEWYVSEVADGSKTTTEELPIAWRYNVKISETDGSETEMSAVTSGEAYSASQAIFFEDNAEYILSCANSNSTGAYICYYNAEGDFVGSTNCVSATVYNKTVTAVIQRVGGAAYMKIRHMAKVTTTNTVEIMTGRYALTVIKTERRSPAESYFVTKEHLADEVKNIVQEVHDDAAFNILQTVSGENIVVNDSSNSPLKGLRIFGRTNQITTTGKNLFNINTTAVVDNVSYVRDDSSVTITTGASLNADGYARLMFENIQVDASKTYTISFDTDSTEEVTIGWYGCTKTANLSGNTHYSVTLSNITTTTFSVGVMVPNTTVTFSNIQIEAGTVATAYEPYTSGVASPSPTFPQRLRTVGVGKNLLQNKAADLTYGGVVFTIGEDGSVTANGTATETLFFKIDTIELKKGVAYIMNGCPSGGGNSSYSIKCDLTDMGALDTGSGVTIIGDGRKDCPINIRIANGATIENLVFKPMIRYADVKDGTYEPYGKNTIVVDVDSQTATVRIPNGLPGIQVTDASMATYTDQNGVMWYADEVDFERGVYVKRVKNIVVDGSTPIEKRYVVNSSTKARFKVLDISDTPVPADPTSKGLAMCDRVSRVTASNTYNAIEGISIDATSNVLIYIDNISEMVIEEMSAWLSENPLSIVYAMVTPIETPLTKEELNQYRALHTNYPATTILNDCDAHMEVKYNADTKSYIDNKIAELVTASIKEG